jgi:ATP-dependent exoDNAse (exonuclease V) alpha subunit
VTNHFTVITGGPHGKTRTVTDILALLHEQPAGDSLRIALAAPTARRRAADGIGPRSEPNVGSNHDPPAPRLPPGLALLSA